jgi:hypothetical protein
MRTQKVRYLIDLLLLFCSGLLVLHEDQTDTEHQSKLLKCNLGT